MTCRLRCSHIPLQIQALLDRLVHGQHALGILVQVLLFLITLEPDGGRDSQALVVGLAAPCNLALS